MRLVRVELSRYFSRRAVALLLLVAAALTALIAFTTVWGSRPVGADELASARAEVRSQVDSEEFKTELARCEKDPTQYSGPGTDAADCEAMLTPRPEEFLPRQPLSLDLQRRDSGITVVVVLAALMIVIGTTFAGADWATGSMGNQLIFEPRRTRVWTAKALAVTIGCTAVAAVLMVAFWLTLYAVAQSRGIVTSAHVEQEIGWLVARGVLLSGLVGLGAFALTMLLRNTVATLALLFAYAAGGEALLAVVPLDRSGRWSLTNNVFAWLQDGVKVFDDNIVCGPGSAGCNQSYTVSMAHGSLFLGTLLLVTLVVSALAFRRRDVP